MRVLYFYQYFTSPKGAWGTRAYEFAHRWVSAGDSVTVLTCSFDRSDLKPDRFLSKFTVEGIDVRVVNIAVSQKHGFARRILSFAAYAGVACGYALFAPADVVLCSSGPLTVGLPGLLARYLRGLPLVFEVRDLWPEGAIQLRLVRNRLVIFLARAFEKSCYDAATRVVALSDGMAEWIRSRYGCNHVVVVPNASDNDLVRAVEQSQQGPVLPPGRKLVVYAGTLGMIDDCDQILEMCRILQNREQDDIDVVIIGDGKERQRLEERARRMELSNIQFLGRLSKESVMAWLLQADCSLFVCKNVPFLDTASPNKLFDAFAAGAPVVQTTQGWIKKFLEEQDCGITVPPDDAEALAAAVIRVVRDDSLAERLSRNGRAAAAVSFDRGLLAAKMRQVLQEAGSGVRQGAASEVGLP